MISDNVMDAIAYIELHRQEAAKQGNVAAACNDALRKLNELLAGEREALQLQGPEGGHAANVEAVLAEIERVKRLIGGGGRGPAPHHQRGEQRQRPARPNQQQHHRPRNRGRRSMGRGGGR